MQQKFRVFLYIIRPNRICVKICDYVNQNTVFRRGIDLSERMVLEMSVIAKAGLLALAAVLLLPLLTVEKQVFRQDNIGTACLPAVDTCPDQGIFSAVHAAGKNVI